MTGLTRQPQRIKGPLDATVRAAALELANEVHQYDGLEAISEAFRLALRDGDPAVTHFVVLDQDQLVGYAQLDADAASSEIAVVPGRRRQGLGRALVRAISSQSPRVRFWAHGDQGPARALAQAIGLVPTRELWEMVSVRHSGSQGLGAADDGVRPLTGSTAPRAGHSPANQGPTGGALSGKDEPAASYRLAAFDAERDRAAWVELNKAAFADHPEQGKWTLLDLDRRMAERWFDPGGLIMAFAATEETGRPSGYVWTKVSGSLGEIYAIGVRPSVQGNRLGTRLLAAGLEHLERRGVAEIRLFVEADNKPAIAAYRSQGFRRTRRDVQYGFAAAATASGAATTSTASTTG